MSTHILSSAEWGSCQESGIKLARGGNSHPVKGIKHTRKWHWWTVKHRNDSSEKWKKISEHVAFTLCQAQSEKVVRKVKQSHWVMSTSNLWIAEWGGCQNNEIRPVSEWHSQTIKHNMRKLSGPWNKGSKRGELTSYQAQNEGVAGSGNANWGWTNIPFCWEGKLPLVLMPRTCHKNVPQGHQDSEAGLVGEWPHGWSRGSCQDNETNTTSEGNSLSVEHCYRPSLPRCLLS
jgi:hypothetical protein